MFKDIDGKLVEVPDDERITPELKAMRTAMNEFLRWASGNSPEVQKLRKQFREGVINQEPGLDWFRDS